MERSRTYECMCLLDNREVRKGWQSLKDAVAGIFTKHGAEILSSRRWDERRLGYPMKGQLRGTYLLLYFKSETGALVAIRRDLQFAEAVHRFLTMQVDEVPETAYEPEAEFDVTAIPEEEAVVEAEPAAPPAPAEKTEKTEKKEPEAKASGEAEASGKAEASGETGGDAAAEGAGDEAEASTPEAATENSEPEAKTEA